MKKKNPLLVFFALTLCASCLTVVVYAACAAGKSYTERYRNCFTSSQNDDTFDKIVDFTLSTASGSYAYTTFGSGAAVSKIVRVIIRYVGPSSSRNSGLT
jgi:hypothetical protein